MTEILSPSLKIVESILISLARKRTVDNNNWTDSEEEDLEIETSVFKKAEGLYCFLLAKSLKPDDFSESILDKGILINDLKDILNVIKKDGFYPSPYSQIPGATDDQYTEFAAFSLDFCALVFSEFKKDDKLCALSKEISKKALSFLINPDNFLLDDKGCRWGGTTQFRRTKIVKQLFTDTYFTSQVLLSLSKIIDHPVLKLNEAKKEEIKKVIQNGCKWLISRIKNNQIYGGEDKDDDRLVYTTWGLKALVETKNYHSEDYNEILKPVITKYVNDIDAKIEKEGVTIGQIFFTVLSLSIDDNPISYDDRSDWGGVFLALISLRKVQDFEAILEEASYFQVLEKVYNGILLMRNGITNLWYKDYFIISIHNILIEAFIEFDLIIKDFSFVIEVSPSMIRRAIKETLSDDNTITIIQNDIYKKLQQSYKKNKQAKIINQDLKKNKIED